MSRLCIVIKSILCVSYLYIHIYRFPIGIEIPFHHLSMAQKNDHTFVFGFEVNTLVNLYNTIYIFIPQIKYSISVSSTFLIDGKITCIKQVKSNQSNFHFIKYQLYIYTNAITFYISNFQIFTIWKKYFSFLQNFKNIIIPWSNIYINFLKWITSKVFLIQQVLGNETTYLV